MDITDAYILASKRLDADIFDFLETEIMEYEDDYPITDSSVDKIVDELIVACGKHDKRIARNMVSLLFLHEGSSGYETNITDSFIDDVINSYNTDPENFGLKLEIMIREELSSAQGIPEDQIEEDEDE